MRVLGLTGNIGAGKSTVGRLLSEAGVPVIDADSIAREVVLPGTQALVEIGARFPGVVSPEGSLDRKALAARIFSDPAERAALNQITHPRIEQEVMSRLSRLRREGAPLAVYEAALLVENGHHTAKHPGAEGAPGLIVVIVPEEEQVRRVLARDGGSEAQVRARIAAQLPQAEKAKVATWVIDNRGSLDDLRVKIARLLAEVRAQAGSLPAAGTGRAHG